MVGHRKFDGSEDVEWGGRIYRRDPTHKALHRQRYFMATTAPRTYLHRDIFAAASGSRLSKHVHVHHADGDWNNNLPSNLVALSPSAHATYHAQSQLRMVKLCDECGAQFSAVFERARWCCSACKERRRRREGSAYVRPKQPAAILTHGCDNCGTQFMTTKSWARFCCARCRGINNRRTS